MSKDKRTPGQVLWNCYCLSIEDKDIRWSDLTADDQAEWNECARQFTVTFLPDSAIAVDRAHYDRLKTAARKLKVFCDPIVRYGGHIPESEALTDEDVRP